MLLLLLNLSHSMKMTLPPVFILKSVLPDRFKLIHFLPLPGLFSLFIFLTNRRNASFLWPSSTLFFLTFNQWTLSTKLRVNFLTIFKMFHNLFLVPYLLPLQQTTILQRDTLLTYTPKLLPAPLIPFHAPKLQNTNTNN